MNVRSMSHKQLKDLKKSLKKINRRFLVFQQSSNPCNEHGISLADIKQELKRRKDDKVKVDERKPVVFAKSH